LDDCCRTAFSWDLGACLGRWKDFLLLQVVNAGCIRTQAIIAWSVL
jgi:hypothetical protein